MSTLKQYNNNDPRGLIGTKVPHCVWEPFNKRLFWQWKRTITYSRKTMFQYIITEKYIYIIMEWSLYRKQLYSKLSDRLGSIIWNYKIFSNSKQVAESTMYDFHNSTDTLKFWTGKRAICKTFLFFIRFWWNLVKL